MSATARPLDGLKVIEFTHMVMGPAAGLILADLGADVIKVEPPGGDKTRRLRGSGAGYFAMYNRNKKSIAINLKSEAGKAIALDMLDDADVFIENFRPGALDKLGFGYGALSDRNPRLIYCSEKGFLEGPYQKRTALDEVAQMMGGLAYMTGPPGRPLRAGASVIDVTGGMFGAIGVLSALQARHQTGRGVHVNASLFETTAFLVGQHIAQFAVTGTPAPPMPARVSAWAIYDVFEVKGGESVFVGVVSDGQWKQFCDAFGLSDWANDPALAANNDRVAQRDVLIPKVSALFKTFEKSTLMAVLEEIGLPYAPINKPEDLIVDPHLTAASGMLDMALPEGKSVSLPNLPISLDGDRPDLQLNPPLIGEHTADILASLGFDPGAIRTLVENGTVELGERALASQAAE
ncbi:MAG: CaiB/BaiF CoA-transferase family protein [Pseudomonadota bacterium]